jgi:hypothetical protein
MTDKNGQGRCANLAQLASERHVLPKPLSYAVACTSMRSLEANPMAHLAYLPQHFVSNVLTTYIPIHLAGLYSPLRPGAAALIDG